MIDWPPPYQLRRTGRARQFSVRIDPYKGVQLVVPKRTSDRRARQFLNEQRAWVEEQLQSIPLPTPMNREDWPTELSLHYLGKTFQLNYHERPLSKRLRLTEQQQHLQITGPDLDFLACSKAIKRWCKRQCELYISPRLQQVASQCQLGYTDVVFRNQQTLWGSCSSQQVLNLNIRLLLLPPALVDYVLVHELCHTVHFDHSKKFWSLVQSFLPNYKQLEEQLKSAETYIPSWWYRER